MDIALIGTIVGGLKSAKEGLQAVMAYKIESEARTRIADALEKLGSAQDNLFELREELFRLQTENDGLRRELKDHEGWEALAIKYRLQETAGGAVVYEFTEAPKHYACPSCFTKRTIQILQDRRVMSGDFGCPGCKATFPVDRQDYHL